MMVDKQHSQIVSALYLMSGIAMVLLAVQNYRYGLFDLVYAAIFVLALFIGVAIYMRFALNSELTEKINLAALSIAAFVIVIECLEHPTEASHWAFPLNMVSFLALSHSRALVFNTTLLGLISLLVTSQQSLMAGMTFACSYTLFIALASAYSRMHQRRSRTLVELAIHDPLTGAYNMRHLEDTLAKEICRSDRTGRALSLVAVEIDYFPQVVDMHGQHQANELLSQFADTLNAMIRAGDSNYADSAKTFYLMLPCTPSEGVVVIAERIRRTIEEHTWPVVDSVTVSLGCTTYDPKHGESKASTLLENAQIALVEAQKNGHNRVCHHI